MLLLGDVGKAAAKGRLHSRMVEEILLEAAEDRAFLDYLSVLLDLAAA